MNMNYMNLSFALQKYSIIIKHLMNKADDIINIYDDALDN